MYVLHCIVLYCIVLHCAVSHCMVLYCMYDDKQFWHPRLRHPDDKQFWHPRLRTPSLGTLTTSALCRRAILGSKA